MTGLEVRNPEEGSRSPDGGHLAVQPRHVGGLPLEEGSLLVPPQAGTLLCLAGSLEIPAVFQRPVGTGSPAG